MNITITSASSDAIAEIRSATGWGISATSLPDNMEIFAIKVDANTAGYFTAKFVDMGPIEYRIIEGIYVKPEYRQRGIATQIYADADALEVVPEQWTKCRELYSRLGFTESMPWKPGIVLAHRPTPFAAMMRHAVATAASQ